MPPHVLATLEKRHCDCFKLSAFEYTSVHLQIGQVHFFLVSNPAARLHSTLYCVFQQAWRPGVASSLSVGAAKQQLRWLVQTTTLDPSLRGCFELTCAFQCEPGTKPSTLVLMLKLGITVLSIAASVTLGFSRITELPSAARSWPLTLAVGSAAQLP